MKFLYFLFVISNSRIVTKPSPPATLLKMLDMNGDGLFNKEDARHRLEIMGIRWDEQNPDMQALINLENDDSRLNFDAVFDVFRELARKYEDSL